jgi:hypothetical protein
VILRLLGENFSLPAVGFHADAASGGNAWTERRLQSDYGGEAAVGQNQPLDDFFTDAKRRRWQAFHLLLKRQKC